MSGTHDAFSHPEEEEDDVAPGVTNAADYNVRGAVQGYIVGLALAAGLTIASFYTVSTHLIWGPGIPVALGVLAVAQIGVHLAFFLHITTAPDNTNNVLALAFGVLIVTLVVGGSLWIMQHLNHNMAMPMQMMKMQT